MRKDNWPENFSKEKLDHPLNFKKNSKIVENIILVLSIDYEM